MVDALNRIMPGVRVEEYLVIENAGTPIALIAHGHQTDSWNNEACQLVGKGITNIAFLLRDLGFGEWHLFMPDEDTSTALWSSSPNTLGEVYEVIGANADLGSLDEVDLFHVFQEVSGQSKSDSRSLDTRPYVFLGHTHGPLSEPCHPSERARWRTYVNSGCGIFKESLTGIEWDGTQDPENPAVRLVVWGSRYGLQRSVLSSTPGECLLQATPAVRVQ